MFCCVNSRKHAFSSLGSSLFNFLEYFPVAVVAGGRLSSLTSNILSSSSGLEVILDGVIRNYSGLEVILDGDSHSCAHAWLLLSGAWLLVTVAFTVVVA